MLLQYFIVLHLLVLVGLILMMIKTSNYLNNLQSSSFLVHPMVGTYNMISLLEEKYCNCKKVWKQVIKLFFFKEGWWMELVGKHHAKILKNTRCSRPSLLMILWNLKGNSRSRKFCTVLYSHITPSQNVYP